MDLHVESQDVAKIFRDSTTPVTGADLRAALDALVGGTPVPEVQKPSVGCNIKWKRGNAPAYA